MSKFSIVFTLTCVLFLSFFLLKNISDENVYTGVREYTKPKKDTQAPNIEFVRLKDGDIIYEDAIYIEVEVTDNVSKPEKIAISGNKWKMLQPWFNPLVVSARDEAGNVASKYIIVEKR